MTDDRLPMTREGYDKLKAELDRLRGAESMRGLAVQGGWRSA